MSEIYNEEYYKNYDVGVGKVNYLDSKYTKDFLTQLASRIAADLHPKTVLDAGCAMGHLVAALRDLGVEAYGIDVSEYAISQVREDIKPYCFVGSLSGSLPECMPQKYDLVVTIEVLEHLYAEDGKKAITNLCSLADAVLFSSTPDDFEDRTHVNVQQREYWARLFFEQGFVDDLNYRPRYLTYYASLFRRSENMVRMVEDYERNIRMSEHEYNKKIAENQNAMQELLSQYDVATKKWDSEKVDFQSSLDEITALLQSEQKNAAEQLIQEREKQKQELEIRQAAYDQMCKELDHYKEHYHAAIAQREDLKQQLAQAQNAYNVISNAFFWKITKPLRVIVDVIKRPLRKIRFFRLINKGVRCWKENGLRYTCRKVKNKMHHRQEYSEIAKKPLFTEAELDAQRKEKFPRDIKFSIVVPLFNTPEKFLHEMIQSVLDQTYSNWELCMADGSDKDHANVGKICRQYVKKDARIKYRKLERNLGISGNTNACLEMATGEYIGLFDHDDLLHPAALHEVMLAICEQKADFIYTDELVFENDVRNVRSFHFKPDFSPDTLRGCNYICHFSIFSKDLFTSVGAYWDSDFDGSQDYDVILRLTEKACKIVHIPKALYCWRSSPNSVASSIDAKPYTMEAAKKCLAAHLQRCGYEGYVEDAAGLSSYKVQYEIIGTPMISIIIPNKDHIEMLSPCITSILDKTTYKNYEIIIVENNSEEKDTFGYYEEVSKNERVKIVYWEGIFNFSAINNYGAQHAKGEYFVLLNNDTEIISHDWLEQMLMYAQRPDVGAVGAMLYYADDTIQHAGVVVGIGGYAGHIFKGAKRGDNGYMFRLCTAQNLSAVTGACIMVPKKVWDQVGGLDEQFVVAANDVDLCLRIRKEGYLIVWTPYAELYHYESKSRGYEDTPEKKKRFEGEVRRFGERWKKELETGDPYYNPNLTLDREDFSLNDKKV